MTCCTSGIGADLSPIDEELLCESKAGDGLVLLFLAREHPPLWMMMLLLNTLQW